VEIGYAVVASRQNEGCATAALLELISIAEQNGARRIEGRAAPHNRASTRVMEKAGMSLTGVVDRYLHYER